MDRVSPRRGRNDGGQELKARCRAVCKCPSAQGLVRHHRIFRAPRIAVISRFDATLRRATYVRTRPTTLEHDR